MNREKKMIMKKKKRKKTFTTIIILIKLWLLVAGVGNDPVIIKMN